MKKYIQSCSPKYKALNKKPITVYKIKLQTWNMCTLPESLIRMSHLIPIYVSFRSIKK